MSGNVMPMARTQRASVPVERHGRFSISELFAAIQWSPDFLAFLYYLAAIITFRVPGADFAAGVCIVLLLARIDTLIVPVPLRWFSAFVVWALFTVIGSQYTAQSFDAWVVLVKLLVVGIIAANVIRTKGQLRFTFFFCVFCFFVYPFRGAITNYLFGYTIFGRALWNYIYENPNDLAALAMLYASLAVAGGFLYRSALLRLGGLLAALAFVVLIFLTQSRGALVGLALSGLMSLLTSKQRLKFLVGAGAVALAAAIFAPASMWDRLGGLQNISTADGMTSVDNEASAEQRYQIAQVAYAIAIENPIIGVGVGAYREAHAVYAAQRRSSLPIAGGRRDAHNTWLLLAAETGVLGLVIFICMLASVALSMRRALRSTSTPASHRDALRALRLGLVAFFLAGTFGSFAYLNLLYIYIAFVAFLTSPVHANPARSQLRRKLFRGLPRRIAPQGLSTIHS